MMPLADLDWLVIGLYLVLLLTYAWWLSRSQFNREDYYVGGRNIGAWPVAISIMATQCSTNGIMGAPAFVAFAAGGGLIWLQYELAVPLAMIALMLLLMPLFRHMRLVSVYEYLEHRFDRRARLSLSALFLFIRAFATAVTVYSISIVINLITGMGFFWSVVVLGVFTVVYDVLGGIRGVIYSDVIQLLILVALLAILLFTLTGEAGGLANMFEAFDPERRQALDFSQHGLGDGATFAFWPMLFGGLFLYMAYYGCDQSQVQRQLSTRNIDSTNQALLLNGLLRFPLVLLYCFVGIGIAVFASKHPDFFTALPSSGNGPDYNLAVPYYMIHYLPTGLAGLGMVALFAAAMSSLDSVLNSLSATTMEDFFRPFYSRHFNKPTNDNPLTEGQELFFSRLITVIWGIITLTLAFFVGDIAPTVLEAINKIGSLANGSILAVFAAGILSRRASGGSVILGLLLGIACNTYLWLYLPNVSWLWWNVIGFIVTFFSAVALGRLCSPSHRIPVSEAGVSEIDLQHYLHSEARVNWYRRSLWLLIYFFALIVALYYLGR